MDKNKISTWAGYVGGGVFFVLNKVSNGSIPGGFLGGILGFILGFGLVRLILTFLPSKSTDSESI